LANALIREGNFNERKFKIAFLDVGLMQNALGVQDSIILEDSVMQINAGKNLNSGSRNLS